jgi:hypothetical protein
MQQRAAPLLLQRRNGRRPLARGEGHAAGSNIGDAKHIATRNPRAAKWRGFRVDQRSKPPLHRANPEHQHVVRTPLRTRVNIGREGRKRIDRNRIPAIAMDEDRGRRLTQGRLIAAIRFAACLALPRPVAETRNDLLLHRIEIEVAHDQQRSALWPVVTLIEAHHLLARGRLQHFGLTDRHTARHRRTGQQEIQLLLAAPALEVIATPPFGQHHTAFAINGGGIEGQLARRLAQQEEALVHQPVRRIRKFEAICREVLPGRGVGVSAEGKTQALEYPHHLAFGHVARSVERHVLDEVRKPLLGVGFIERAECNREADRHGRRGKSVVPKRIAHAVGQRAEAHGRIRRDVARLMRPRTRHDLG